MAGCYLGWLGLDDVLFLLPPPENYVNKISSNICKLKIKDEYVIGLSYD